MQINYNIPRTESSNPEPKNAVYTKELEKINFKKKK